MKLRILSDLHIEFHPFAIPAMPDDSATVLVLAGDVGVIYRREELEAFLRDAAARFRAVIYILGNHEYYRGQWPAARASLPSWNLPDNLHVLERDVVRIDDVHFVGATLWTDFDGGSLDTMRAVEHAIHDYHYIDSGAGPAGERIHLRPEAVYEDHRVSLAWLESTLGALHARGETAVLVTHHGFSRRSIHEHFRDNALNGAFVSECADMIKRTAPLLAIHGHVHNSFDYRLGTTRVLVNPRGYTRRDDTQENLAFDPCLGLDLETLS
ncbi:MAG: metallophosphoesterase [Castellaniella sp.]